MENPRFRNFARLARLQLDEAPLSLAKESCLRAKC